MALFVNVTFQRKMPRDLRSIYDELMDGDTYYYIILELENYIILEFNVFCHYQILASMEK